MKLSLNRKKNPGRRRFWEHFKGIASTLVFVWFFTNHIAQATVVPTESMVPTILAGDHFLLDKLAFQANYPEAVQKFLPERTIHRGDILAFWSPEDRDLRLIKRVIGLPGDTIEIRAGEVYINGKKLDEPYLINTPQRRSSENMSPISIPTDRFFMMGDNRNDSRDSRYWGLAHREDVIGKPMFVYWSYESDPYPANGRTFGQWAQHYASVATHFFTRTRWLRTGTVLR